jgi:hypothetical protein
MYLTNCQIVSTTTQSTSQRISQYVYATTVPQWFLSEILV